MSKMIGGEPTNSWLQRARAEVTPDARFGTEHNKIITPFAATSRTIWCAWEVWLHHIDQPRRRPAGRYPQSTD